MAARVGANFVRRCMSQAAGNAKNAKTAKQISSLVIPGYLGVTGTIGAYQGYYLRFSEDGNGDVSKSTRIKKACEGAIIGPIAVPLVAYIDAVALGTKVFFPREDLSELKREMLKQIESMDYID